MKRFKRIYIEISNICNLQCSFCPVVERDKKIMPTNDFEKVLAQASPLAEQLCLHLMGEPLAHPQFPQIINRVEQEKALVQLTTNGLLLERYSELLLSSPALRQINFSVQSYKDNFPERPIQDYLQKLLGFCDKARAQKPDLYINFRLWNLGSEAKENDSVFEIIGEHFKVDIKRSVDVGHIKSKKIIDRIYLHFDSRFEWPSLDQEVRSERGSCYALKDHIGIHADGRVVPCCLDKEAQLELGNCLEEPLDDILQGPRAQGIQIGFQRGQRVEELCKRCSFIDRFG